MHFSEAAVMLAFAFYLFKQDNSLTMVEIHPDGEHGKQFNIREWLLFHGFELKKPEGTTKYGGIYCDGVKQIYVSLKPGLGDVVASTDNYTIVAECKGGIINTKHPGQKSRLRKGLCETVGLLMARPLADEIQYAVVPKTPDTERLGQKMQERCRLAGIEVLLLEADGEVIKIEKGK